MRSTTPEIFSAATTSRRSPAIGARSAISWTARRSVSISSASSFLSSSTTCCGALDVALDEAAHRLADRMLGEPAHLADERAQPVDVLVERLERMSAGLLH